MLEGCALLNLVAWLLVGDMLLNGVVALVAWALMAAAFPTESKLGATRP